MQPPMESVFSIIPIKCNSRRKMPRSRLSIFALILITSLTVYTRSHQAEVTTPKDTIKLFNGKDLANFHTWLVDHQRKDPELVFSVVDQIDGAPAIRVSGQRYGALITKQKYANYRLIVEFRWSVLTWGGRKDRAKDSGILLHAQGPEGNTKPDFNGPWMRSVECQIIEGGLGDFILVNGYDSDGQLLKTRLSVTSSKDRDGEAVYDPTGKAMEFWENRINWYGRDPDWKDALGFRGRKDVESPDGQWTKVEVICDGDKVTNIVNGKIVNEGTKSNLTQGQILLQSEGRRCSFGEST
ncbi:MAG: DUF1080 domain-containing protein [Pyrinomonadaceae bacterium]